MARRFAIYLAPPPDSAVAIFGRHWLGRDASSGEPLPQPSVPGLTPERLWAITRSPRHYGFHGTLKAPFELAAGSTPADLHDEVRAFADRQRPFEIALEVSSLSGFLAFTPAAASAELDRLAAAAVIDLDPPRRPAEPAEVAKRRRQSRLTPRQDAHLLRWGYPYVFEDFRFHMTLTGRLDDPERSRMLAILRDLTSEVCAETLLVDAVAVFEQADRETPFRMTARCPFAA